MKVDIEVPDGKSGDWGVGTFTVAKEDVDIQIIGSFSCGGRYVPEGTYKCLTRNGQTIMSNTPDEIRDQIFFVNKATGDVLINGLGLGVTLKMVLAKPEVTSVTVIENSPDVIKLVAPTYLKDPRVKIIEADAMTYKPPKGKKFQAVWHDIWDNICSDNLKDMIVLHRRYGNRTKYQGSWARYLCERNR
jgi:16S rRNA A1518/A1519 N6-dimethyltransferase RsmA/KsgA/DIM1 with predicted DNA glycosylase/AP lyase activity